MAEAPCLFCLDLSYFGLIWYFWVLGFDDFSWIWENWGLDMCSERESGWGSHSGGWATLTRFGYGNLDDEGEINKRTTVILSVWQPRNWKKKKCNLIFFFNSIFRKFQFQIWVSFSIVQAHKRVSPLRIVELGLEGPMQLICSSMGFRGQF